VTHFFSRNDYESRLPDEWRDDLDRMKLRDLIRMAADEEYYWNGMDQRVKKSERSSSKSWCAPLLEFIKQTRKLAFHKSKVVKDVNSGEEHKEWIMYAPAVLGESLTPETHNDQHSAEHTCPESPNSGSLSNRINNQPTRKFSDDMKLREQLQSATLTDLFELLSVRQRQDIQLYKGMNPKKVLEVILLSRLIAATSSKASIDNVIDIGSGKGYLSHVLAVEYDMKVIGIDSNEHVAECANEKVKEYEDFQKRSESLKGNPNWVRSNKRRRKRLNRKNEETKKSSGWVRSLCSHIDSNMQCSDFLKIVGDEDLFQNQRTMLIGLHTCGNLASTTLKLFVNSEAEAVVNAGCCYHKLLEVGDLALRGDNERIGFPLSSHAKQWDFKFTTGARDLGCLALSQWDWEQMDRSINVFKMQSYRWVLDHILIVNGCKPAGGILTSVFTVGALPSAKSTTFGSYCHAACEKLITKGKITAPQSFVDRVADADTFINDMDEYYKTFSPEKEDYIHSVAVWWSLRAVMSSLVEEMVLVDRVLYLLEQGCEAELIRLFPPDVSPRGYVLIGRKSGGIHSGEGDRLNVGVSDENGVSSLSR